MSDDASASARHWASSSALSEADYARMRDTLTETTRGRWFLEEFARRNRSADTRTLLDAVTRIERVVAAQQAPAPAPASQVTEAVRELIQRARTDLASAQVSNSSEIVTQARRATRIIREIAWQMRGSGNDPRICNILDAQLEAIDAHVYAPTSAAVASLRDRFEMFLQHLEAAIDVANAAPIPSHDVSDDDAVLARIAAEMAGLDDQADRLDEPHHFTNVRSAAQRASGDSLAELLTGRGIKPSTSRDDNLSSDRRFS